jgi:hypothetical protein
MGCLFKPKKPVTKTDVQQPATEHVESMVHSHNIGETYGVATNSELVADNLNADVSGANEENDEDDDESDVETHEIEDPQENAVNDVVQSWNQTSLNDCADGTDGSSQGPEINHINVDYIRKLQII